MKVLVATNRSQGSEPGDYHWAIDGELVLGGPLIECCEPRCGCGRGFPGLASSRATTTAEVVELAELDRSAVAIAVRDSLERQGYLHAVDPEEVDEAVDDEVQLIEEIVAWFPVGTVIARSGTQVWARSQVAGGP
jgi:hypothetical protein